MPLCDDAHPADRVRASGRQHPVQHRDANGCLCLLSVETTCSQPGSGYRLVAAHRRSVPVVPPTVPITLKMPATIVSEVRAYSVISGLTLGEIVTRAITAFLTAVRGHG
jgi:hypothetical protein